MAPFSSIGEKRQNPISRQTTTKFDEQNTLHREQRRRQYLDKVRKQGEDKKWDVRGEQILREDFLTTERQWIASRNRSAPPLMYFEDDDMKDMTSGNEHQNSLLDQALSQENEEVDALVSSFEEHSTAALHGVDKRVDYGSDDEKYNSIFLDLLSSTSTEGSVIPRGGHVLPQGNHEAVATESMDTSGG
ncbi:MAG: hypothetical protein LQ337_007686 [Flavoplaca oasis]|nr:MAG: hypothetical protein LQ337_007686 [Flavoplaca oasis]